MSQTRKRHQETEKDEGKKETKRRRSCGEALDWLREKGEVVRQFKGQKREDMMEQHIQNELLFMKQLQGHGEQTNIFQHEMHQQKQQQFALLQHQMMQLMQQQTEAMSHMFKNGLTTVLLNKYF